MLGLLTPFVGDHVNIVPLLTALALMAAPLQIVVSPRVVSVTDCATVTVNVLEIVQVPVVPVTVYVVVEAGDRTGFAMAGLLTPVVGDQLYVVALLVMPGLNEA